MKAISLWQPYAEFMRMELKVNETRGWASQYRGDLAICSAKRNWLPGEFGADVENLSNVIAHAWYKGNKFKQPDQREILFPKGYVLCVVDVIECWPTDGLEVSPLERTVGNYASGRFAWITRNCRPLKKPVPVTGRQGFFNLSPDVEAKVKAQL